MYNQIDLNLFEEKNKNAEYNISSVKNVITFKKEQR